MTTIIKTHATVTREDPAAVYLAGLSTDTSRAGMESTLAQLAELVTGGTHVWQQVDWSALRFQHIQGIKSKLLESYSPATVNKYLSALRGVLKAAWRMGQLSTSDYQKAVDVAGVKSRTLPKGRALSQGELSSLMLTCSKDSSASGVRDAAIIALLYAGGLRRAELVVLKLADVEHRDDCEVSLRVQGKGHAERLVWLDNGALDALHAWLAVRGDEPGSLFPAIRKGGAIQPKGMTAQAIYLLLKKRADDAGIRECSPHDFRRTFISDLLDAGADLAVVSGMAGHANVQTTARYDRRGEQAKQRASRLLSVPFYGKKK